MRRRRSSALPPRKRLRNRRALQWRSARSARWFCGRHGRRRSRPEESIEPARPLVVTSALSASDLLCVYAIRMRVRDGKTRGPGVRIAAATPASIQLFRGREHMHKWIAAHACAAAVLSLAVASAQTGTSTSKNRPAANSPQRVTVTGCFTQGTSASRTASAARTTANAGGWILSNATMSGAAGTQTSSTGTASPSRSGSPSNEGKTATNRNGTAGIAVSGSTSTVVGTRGTNTTPGGTIDTEAHGAGTLGATDQAGSTVGAGATAGATSDAPRSSTAGSGETTGTSGAASTSSYQLSGITHPDEYAGKRVEITGTLTNARARMLRVSSVRVLGDNCQ